MPISTEGLLYLSIAFIGLSGVVAVVGILREKHYRKPTVLLHISHGARVNPDDYDGCSWFVVGPPDDASLQRAQVESLLAAGRTVVTLEVEPGTGKFLPYGRR